MPDAPPARRITGIDGMRAVAALAVFVTHLVAYWQLADRLPHHVTSLSQVGAHGVDLFVVISGFCLALPVARRAGLPLNVRDFFVRRATRILPPYYVALAICAALAVAPATWGLVVSGRASWSDVTLHAVLLQTFVPDRIATINGSFWSIALEAQLYLVFPLLVVVWRRVGLGPVLAMAMALSLAWWASGLVADAWVLGDPHLIFDRLIQFACGMWAAQRLAADQVPRRSLLWSTLVIGGLAAASASTLNISVGNSILWAIPATAAVLLAARRFTSAAFGVPLERLGLVSYSFYLLQQPVLLLTADPANAVTSSPALLLVLGMTACLGLTIMLSVVMYRVVEAPSIRWGVRLTGRRAASPEHPVASLSADQTR